MKQTKWQRLAAIGLCGSLLVNAFSGVTAVAETVTIESSPTAKSSAKEETQASSETQETTTETSREEVTQEIEKQAEVAVEKKEAPPVKVEQKEAEAQQEVQLTPQLPVQIQNRAIGVKEGKKVSELSTWFESEANSFPAQNQSYVVPESRFSINIASEDKTSLNMEDFQLTSEMGLDRWRASTNLSGFVSPGDQTIPVSNVPTTTGLDILIPSQTLNVNYLHYWSDMIVYYLKDPVLTVPKYIDTIEVANSGIFNRYELYSYLERPYNIKLVKTNNSYTLQQPLSHVWNKPYSAGFAAELRATYEKKQAGLTYVAAQQDIDLTTTYKKVTENFVDATGAKITPPTGFTQGQQTSITSNDFTYTSAKALPDTYKAGGKTYKFKGWYKGTDKTALKTTKTPSYAVTYDDQDDMTAVYEVDTGKDYNFPSKTVNFQFIDEAGTIISPTPFTITTDLQQEINSTYTKLGSITGINSGNTKRVTIPAKTIRADVSLGGVNNYGTTNTRITIPKFYENISVYTGSAYTQATLNRYSTADNTLIGNPTSNAPLYYGLNKMTTTQFKVSEYDSTTTIPEQSEYLYNRLYVSGASRLFNSYVTPVGTIYYQLTNRKVTENFVDASGAKITPPTGFTQGNKVVIDSENFTYTSAKALPATYTVGDKNYKFKGWYKGTDKTALKTTKTPSYAVTYDDKDDMTAVYEEVQATAEMTVSRLLEVVSNEASMIWTVRLKNTSEVPLTNVKLAPTAKWAAGISAPTQLAVRLGNTPNKIIPVTAEQWRTGVNLGVEIPVNGEALVTVNTAKITGEPRQLLTAEMTASGNFSAVTASNFVRIQGEDQTIEPTPAEEGFISMPTFDFGKIMISGSTKQYSLKKAADYYGNGTRNPYLRIKKSQPNWQLTAQLSQLKASTDSLPTSTRLLLGNADVAAIENYNLVTELTNKVGITEPLALTSDGTSTPVILNNQFTGNDVYQLEFDFASVKLEVPANQGKINEKYQGTVTWNLVTGP